MRSPSKIGNLLARVLVIGLLIGTAGCSSAPDWVNPTNWFGGSDQDAADDSGNAQTPDLASIPNKPAPPSTPDEQKQVSDSLAADRAGAQYSAEALQAGNEPSAPPPPATPPPEQVSGANTPSPPVAGNVDQSAAGQVAPAPAEQASPSEPSPAPPEAAAEPPAPQVASTEPAAPTAARASQAESAGDAQLGFEASKAPPLDPSVSRYVPRAILERVEQSSGSPAVAPVTVKPDSNKSSANDRRFIKAPSRDNQAAESAAPPAVRRRPQSGPAARDMLPASYAATEQLRRVGTAYFRSDAAKLTGEAVAAVRAAAQSFAAAGGTGFIRVVGHSSGYSSLLPAARRLELVFQRSQDYAAAVAQELIRDGVPAEKVLIEAVGDSEPAAAHSAPAHEAGNRRAEIFM